MLGDVRTLDGKEGPCAHVQADLFYIDTACSYVRHGFGREMEACGGCSNRPPHARVGGLITLQVDAFGLTVKIRRDGHPAADVKHLGERGSSLPAEFHDSRLAIAFQQSGLQVNGCQLRGVAVVLDKVVFPALRVSYNALPAATGAAGEGLVIFGRCVRLQAEYLYMRSAAATEKQSCRHYFGVVKHHQSAFREHFWQFMEYCITAFSLSVD